MKRRLVAGVPLGVFLAMCLGLVLLMLGVAWLFAVTAVERREALAQIPKDRAALEQAASAELEQALAQALVDVDADIERALADPYQAGAGLVLVDGETLVLPRAQRPRGATRARGYLATLDGEPARGVHLPTEPEVATRVALARDAAASPEAYAAWLDHRARHTLPLDVDLATTLYALERLDRAGALDPTRAAALLRDGVARPDRRLPGLFEQVLTELSRLSSRDVRELLTRAASLARRTLVRVDDVLARVEAPALASDDDDTRDDDHGDPAPRFVAALRRGWQQAGRTTSRLVHTCTPYGCVALRATRDGALRGRIFETTAWLDALARRWIADGRLEAGAFALLDDASPTPRVRIEAMAWLRAEELATERFAMKVGGLAVVALLGVGVFVMAILLQRRRTAYIELRAQLLRAVTHELKTPLASISALAQTLELRLGPDHPQARDYPTRIVAVTERLGFLVDNVLSFARLERGAWQPRMAPLSVSELAAWLAADPVARAVRPIVLTSDVPEDLVLVADPDLVHLLLSNLLDNAAKYARAERVRVTFSARADARGVRLVVSDDGPGLGDQDPARLFDDFRRGRVDGVSGTGLGLAICRWVVALHGGAIRVAATGPAGTTFEATFPRRAAPAPDLARPVARARPEAS